MNDTKDIQFRLYRLGYLKSTDIDGLYGPITTSAMKKFQADQKLPVTGKADAKSKSRLIELTAKYEPDYDSGTGTEYKDAVKDERFEAPTVSSGEENLNAFFDRNKILRKANIPITIEYGPNKKQRKTITSVFFRSLGQQLDGSGNPVYDTIEFIGRDIEEE